MRAHFASDDGAARLGEVALVDRTSRVGQSGLVFFNTLFDENAASHIALGAGIVRAIPRARAMAPEERHAAGINHSSVHTDFMIGSPGGRDQRRRGGRHRDADPRRRRLGSLIERLH